MDQDCQFGRSRVDLMPIFGMNDREGSNVNLADRA